MSEIGVFEVCAYPIFLHRKIKSYNYSVLFFQSLRYGTTFVYFLDRCFNRSAREWA